MSGVHLILDSTAHNLRKNLEALTYGGVLVYVDLHDSCLNEMNIANLMSKQAKIMAVNMNRTCDQDIVTNVRRFFWPLIGAGVVKSTICRTFSLSEAACAHTCIESTNWVKKIIFALGPLAAWILPYFYSGLVAKHVKGKILLKVLKHAAEMDGFDQTGRIQMSSSFSSSSLSSSSSSKVWVFHGLAVAVAIRPHAYLNLSRPMKFRTWVLELYPPALFPLASPKIADCCRGFGADVIMASELCQNGMNDWFVPFLQISMMIVAVVLGTEKCMKLLKKLGKKYDIVVNIQGDEPWIEPEIIDGIVKAPQVKLLSFSTEV
ncbi:hypothetical protein ACH5RR_034957 [Cinchona calisaya]|uniref:Uncharacterized protein n=1 Tax=Cinchona calisaya TaxID=153742 RepID=A0ABD2YCF9_9GENT